MTRYVPLTYEAFHARGTKGLEPYTFAASRAIVPIVGLELANVASSMPIGFLQEGGVYAPVALMSFVPDRNLFVAPNGRWLGQYVPIAVRTYPFRLLRQEGSIDNWALCIDDECPAIVALQGDAAPFFDAPDEFNPSLKAVISVLTEFERSRLSTNKAIAALAQAGVVRPWEIKASSEKGESVVSGLHRIDEDALNQLDPEAFLRLRVAHALPFAYGQLLSTAQIRTLQQLSGVQDQLRRSQTPKPESLEPTFSITDQDSLHFG